MFFREVLDQSMNPLKTAIQNAQHLGNCSTHIHTLKHTHTHTHITHTCTNTHTNTHTHKHTHTHSSLTIARYFVMTTYACSCLSMQCQLSLFRDSGLCYLSHKADTRWSCLAPPPADTCPRDTWHTVWCHPGSLSVQQCSYLQQQQLKNERTNKCYQQNCYVCMQN